MPWLKSIPLSLKCNHLTPSYVGLPFITQLSTCLADSLGSDCVATGQFMPPEAIDLHANS